MVLAQFFAASPITSLYRGYGLAGLFQGMYARLQQLVDKYPPTALSFLDEA